MSASAPNVPWGGSGDSGYGRTRGPEGLLEMTQPQVISTSDLQATIVLGQPGIAHSDPRFYAATLVNYVLGGSDFSSRASAPPIRQVA